MSVPMQQSSTPVQSSSDIPVTVPVTPYVESAGVTIAGVEVLPTSSIAVLRAACTDLKISQSESSSKDVTRDPVPVQTAEKPEDEEEIKRHQLTHTPYAAWCEACVQGKGRAERHESDAGRLQHRELPSLSFDFHILAGFVNQWASIQQLQNNIGFP